jgi:hypothetical protein
MHLQQRSPCEGAKIQNSLGDGGSTFGVQCLVSPPSSPTTTSNAELYNIVRDYLFLTA